MTVDYGLRYSAILHEKNKYLSASTTFTCLLLLLVLFVRFFLQRQQEESKDWKKKLQLPPGPRAWPVVGSLWHLMWKLPHHAFRELSAVYGPIVFLYIGSTPALTVSCPKIVEEIFKEHDNKFDHRPVTAASEIIGRGKAMTFTHGDYWRHVKTVATRELLTRQRVHSFQGVRKVESLELLRSMLEASTMGKAIVVRDIIFSFTTRSFSQMMLQRKRIFGPGQDKLIHKTEKELQDLVLEAVELLGVFCLGDYIPFLKRFDIQGYEKRMRKLSEEIDGVIGRILDEHRKAVVEVEEDDSVKDFIDVLLALPGRDGSRHLHEDTIKILPMEMIVAANDSTNATIEWALTHIVRDPRVKERLQQELDMVVGTMRLVEESDLPELTYLQACVKEVLRLHPPSPVLIPHESSTACTVAGYHIPASTQLYINVYAIGRDPRVWESPDTFWPERFLADSNPNFKRMDVIPGAVNTTFEFIPFGWGKRSCPGVNLGYLTVQATLARILHFFDIVLPGGLLDVDMEEAYGISVFRANPLQIVATPRVHESLILPSPAPLHKVDDTFQ